MLTLLAACGGGSSEDPADPPPTTSVEFRHEGLDGRVVSHLYWHGDRLFATTDDGLFGKTIGQDHWESLGLADHKVQDIAILAGEHWLAAVFASSPAAFLEPQLLETVNGGANWLPVDHDFGDPPGSGEGMYALHFDSASGRLYATGIGALAMSVDLGRSWEQLAGFWNALAQPKEALNLNPARGQVWFGGQNAIEEMELRRHDLGTGETEVFPLLLPSPATIKGITLDPDNAHRVLASGEGGVLQTLDNGATWTNLLGDVDHRFYFQSALNPSRPETIYTAGWTKSLDAPQQLIVEVSHDSGGTWTAFAYDDLELFGGAWSIAAVIEGPETVVYVGLFRGGIIKVRWLVTTI